jgi:hypothetical protein
VCGFDFLRTELLERWDGVLVCEKDWRPKPPQEDGFVIPTRIPPPINVHENTESTWGCTFTASDSTYVQLFNTHKFGSGDFSFEAYVSTDYSAGFHYVISNFTGVSNYRAFGLSNTGAINFIFSDSGGDSLNLTSDTTGYNDDNLHHIVGVRSGQSGYIYVDGSLDGSGSGSGIGDTDTTVSEDIGRLPSDSNYFDGVIRYVAIYNRALTAEDVTFKYSNLYVQSGLDSDGDIYHVPGLIGRWIFDKGTDGVYGDGTLVNDDSGLSPDGKMYNFQSDPWVEL